MSLTRNRSSGAWRLVACAMVIAITAAACGGGRASHAGAVSTATAPSPTDGLNWLAKAMQARTEMGDYNGEYFRTLDEALPNVAYAHANGRRTTTADLVVVGTITDVQKGVGFVVAGDDAPGATGTTSFDDPNARWRNVYATVAVDSVIGSSDAPKQVTVALTGPVPSDFPLMAVGLKALGRVVLFLQKNSPLVSYDPSLYVSPHDALLTATVAPDGTLALPFAEPEQATALLAATPKLADLQARGASARTIALAGNPPDEKRADGR